jgi:hypothetical protein
MIENARYLAWPSAGHGDYTTNPAAAMTGEPEPVGDEWLATGSRGAATRHEEFTLRRAAEHGIRALLQFEGPASSASTKQRVADALRCDVRTIERAAGNMPDLKRTHGGRSGSRWQLNSDKPPRISEKVAIDALRQCIELRIVGERQSPFATDREIAAELMAGEWLAVMDATVRFEHNGSTVEISRPPHDHDWRPRNGRPRSPQRDTWRQGPGWRITAASPDD